MSWSADAYPPTVNDPALWAWAQGVVPEASSEGQLRTMDATMGGEDFSFIANEVPSLFLALGQGDPAWTGLLDPRTGDAWGPLDTTVTVHNARFVLHEGVLQTGVALHAHLALQQLKALSAQP